ncbi:MAG: hypothetical protein IT210_17760 [Armatimonadetes bacterium]|nr:hypothetical protein [Armatimonadota bacterium]
MPDLKKDASEMADKAASVLGRFIRKSRETISEVTQTSRLKLEIKELEARRDEVHMEMGKKVWALYEKGLIKNADLLSLCQDIERIGTDIGAKEKEIEEIRARRDEEEEEADVSEEESGIDSEPEAPAAEPAPPQEPKRPESPEKPIIPIELDETPGQV